MKKAIAGAAIVATIFGTGTAALADGATTTATTKVDATVLAQTGTPGVTSVDANAAGTITAGSVTTTTDATGSATTGTDLPEVSLTPDKWFYSFKLFIEKLQVALTFDAANKAAVLEQQAQTRLAEAKLMLEAGKTDLAQKALREAQGKLKEAEKAIGSAADSNKDLSKLSAMIEADQGRYAKVLTAILEKAPVEVRDQMESVVADLLVQVAANKDTAKKDEQPKQEAQKVVEEAKVKVDASEVSPRIVLVLNAMAKASGKSLDEVIQLYNANHGLGYVAQQLGLKMGSVQHAAQIEWKANKKGAEVKVELKGEVKAEAKTENDDDHKDRPLLGITVPGANISVDQHGKGNNDQGDHNQSGSGSGKDHGNGHGKGKH